MELINEYAQVCFSSSERCINWSAEKQQAREQKSQQKKAVALKYWQQIKGTGEEKKNKTK